MAITFQKFIVETFSETELLILCDSDEQLQKVREEFSDSMPLGEKVRRLIGFCKRHRLSSILWAKVKEERKEQWDAYQMPDKEPDSPVGLMRENSKEGEALFREMGSIGTIDSLAVSPTIPVNKTLPLRVFLCHAKTDKPSVYNLYDYLRKRGIHSWLDSVDLLPGQKWQVEIPKAIESSDVILICLSKNSVNKEGYVQKEIKFALDKALEIPDEHIFLIPARLEECNVPNSLQNYQWVDLFEKDGYSKLMKSLKLRAQQLIRAIGE